MCALAKCCTFSEVPTLIFTPQPKNSLFQLLHLKLHANKTAHGHKDILETAFIPREARLCLWKNNPNPFSEGLRIFQCVSFSNFKKKMQWKTQKDKVLFSPQIVVALLLQTLNSEKSAILGSVFLLFFSLLSFLFSFLLSIFLSLHVLCMLAYITACMWRSEGSFSSPEGPKLKKSGCVLSSFLLCFLLLALGLWLYNWVDQLAKFLRIYKSEAFISQD